MCNGLTCQDRTDQATRYQYGTVDMLEHHVRGCDAAASELSSRGVDDLTFSSSRGGLSSAANCARGPWASL